MKGEPFADAILADRPVRITIPASVAFNLDQFNKVLVNLAERLGCKPCLSGRDCYFRLERDWVVNPQSLAVDPVGGGL